VFHINLTFFSDILSITIVGFSVNQWRKC